MMDRRDYISNFGPLLKSLPELSVDMESMTATFHVEADTPSGSRRPVSFLESAGAELDTRIGFLLDDLIDFLTEKEFRLFNKEILPIQYKAAPWRRDMFLHYPETPSTRKEWTLVDMLLDLVQNGSLGHFFHLYINVEKGIKRNYYKERIPHTAMVEISLGILHSFKVSSKGESHPGLRIHFYVERNKPKVASVREQNDGESSNYNHYNRLPFQIKFGNKAKKRTSSLWDTLKERASKGWNLVETGSITCARVGRAINRLVNGEMTKEDRKKAVFSWLETQGVEVDHSLSSIDVELDVIKKAMEEVGDWAVNFLDALPIEHTIRLKWDVCSTCNGRGKHVNPSIDAHGISSDEFDDDPDFREEYLKGVYDVTCYECGGRTTVVDIDDVHTSKETLKEVERQYNDEETYRREVMSERRMGC